MNHELFKLGIVDDRKMEASRLRLSKIDTFDVRKANAQCFKKDINL